MEKNLDFIATINDGYKVFNNILDTSYLNGFSRDIEFVSSLVPLDSVFKTDDGRIKQIQNLHNIHEYRLYYEYLMHLFDLKNTEVLNMQYFIKHPNYKITAPHMDGAYFDDVDSDIFTFWIPLQKVSIENSTMFYKKWNGNRDIIEHSPCGSNIRTRTGKTGISQYIVEADMCEYEPIKLNYGDLVVHNQFTAHYTNENKTEEPRIALTCIIKINNQIK
jgi:ectoine hydroxylase-related dioxygenase (phytanoyl-CoA dioxygenase family)